MDKVLTHQVTPEQDGMMLKQVLQNQFRFSRRFLRSCRLNQAIQVNGECCYFTSRIKAGDQIVIRLPEERSEALEPQDVPFGVVYEDADLIVIDKPAGVVVHPTYGFRDQTLGNGLMKYWLDRGEQYRFRPVTRLDKDTSGLLVVAKHAYAHAFLADQMKKKRYERTYLAVVKGVVAEDHGTIQAPIGVIGEEIRIRAVEYSEESKPAVTHYEVVKRFATATLLQLTLETGRTHQIRIHTAFIGHPILGDAIYGDAEEMPLISRQALHAFRLRLFHPRERIWKEWSSAIPRDMRELMAVL